MSKLIALVAVVLVSCAVESPSAEDDSEELDQAQQATIRGFNDAIGCTGLNSLEYLFYGCFCGPGNSGTNHTPVDATDDCCEAHDACYGTGIPGCNCMDSGIFASNAAYDQTCTNQVPSCNAVQPNACAAACCACDVKAAKCFKAARDSYRGDCFRPRDWKTQCGEGVIGCCSNEDCNSGCLVTDECVGGVCVPLDFAFTTSAVDCKVEEAIVDAEVVPLQGDHAANDDRKGGLDLQ